MNIKNNIEIKRLDDQGRGIGYIDGKIAFIPNTLINEIVDIKITKETTKYYEGNVINYVKKSNQRINSKCPYYKECGGCNLLHMDYNNQIEYKKNKLTSILNKFSHIKPSIEIIKNKDIFNYRNKIDLKINNGLWGYYNSSTHNFISVDECLLAKESINNVLKYKNFFKVDNGNIIIRSNYNDEILIVINSNSLVDIDINSLKKYVKLVGIIINDKCVYGEKFFIEYFNNKYFKVNYNSFFQVNRYMTNEMISIIENRCDGDVLLDLYCGVGFLGQVINYKYKKIYGIEINENSILDAIYNSKLNKIVNTYYLCGDSSKIVNKIHDNIDTLIIDPPRSGLVKNMINDVISFNSKNIIYISCNPISLARDLNYLKEYYDIEKIYMLDMFSNTFHIESVCVLNLK